MTDQLAVPLVSISPVEKKLNPMALGGFVFGAAQWAGEQAAALLATMEAAWQNGINHFDTASSYGDGSSERLLGQFLADKREQVFLASKANVDEVDAGFALEQVNRSLERLQTDVIDLYYIHWPRQGRDLRPFMEGLEQARQQGKIKAIGVSNFSVEQMVQVAEVGQINAHQLCYNLLWRFAEKEIIPYCREHGIVVITYSSIAQGVLTGKFPRQPKLEPDDQRAGTVHFDDAVWPHVYEAVEELKSLAQEVERPLTHLAIRWVLHQEDVNTALVGARRPEQVIRNVEALTGGIPVEIFKQMTEISNDVIKHIPDTGNMYRYYP
jgi:aryl-alcohol dehydrogenase-like predicted oxidoreductase